MSYQKIKEEMSKIGVVLPEEKIDFLSVKNKDGLDVPLPCAENVYRAIRSFSCVRYDRFKTKYEIRVNDTWEVREDHHDIALHSRMAQQFSFLAKQYIGHVRDAITMIGSENTYDSAQEYITSLTWDGVARLDNWLSTVFHVEDTEYYRKVGSNWIKGMIQRIMYPGSKFDFAILIHGAQGIRKSTSLLVLAGEKNHAEFTELHEKDFQQNIQGKLIVEFSEGAVFSKSDQNTLKAIVSRQQDTFRLPYAHASKDFPRRCVFAVTANNDEILKDETGNRRWWVVFCPNQMADTEWLGKNREQLFAEAYHRVMTLKETSYEIPKNDLETKQKSIRVSEENEDIISQWYDTIDVQEIMKGITIRQVYCGVFEPRDRNGEIMRAETVQIPKRVEMSIARVLKHLGLEKQRMQYSGARSVLWFPIDSLQGIEVVYPEKKKTEEVTQEVW